MTYQFSFLTVCETPDREVDVLVVFNATPGRKATRLDPPEPVTIDDLDIEAPLVAVHPPTAEELGAIRCDSLEMDRLGDLAMQWLDENKEEL